MKNRCIEHKNIQTSYLTVTHLNRQAGVCLFVHLNLQPSSEILEDEHIPSCLNPQIKFYNSSNRNRELFEIGVRHV